MQYLNKKNAPNTTHLVLADRCQQLDNNNPADEAEGDGNEDDLQIYSALVFGEPAADSTEAGKDEHRDEVDDNPGSVTIFFCNVPDLLSSNGKLNDACVDSGAQRTLIGKKHALLHIEKSGVGSSMLQKFHRQHYKFGDRLHQGIRALQVDIPVEEDYVICIAADVIDLDVPLLIDLDTLTHLKAIINFSADTMTTTSGIWHLPLRRKLGLVYIEWPITVYYTEAELRKAHRHFYHPSTDKLLNAFHCANPDLIDDGTHKKLTHVGNTCDAFQ